MPRGSALVSVEIDVGAEPSKIAQAEPRKPFRILVAGNFSGGAGSRRRPVPVDRDNFNEVLAWMAPSLRLPCGETGAAVAFREIEDFHPDRLFQNLATFQALRDLRARLGKRSARANRRLAQTDGAITGEMRAILHRPQFQSLEAAWRGLYFLVQRLRTGEDLRVLLLDLPQDELTSTELRQAVGEIEWGALAGLYYFGPDDENALKEISFVACIAGAPFLSGLAPNVEGLTQVFGELRQSSHARWVGLAMPRFLLRLPYGKNAAETELFVFEELSENPEHERYLWGHPAILCAYLLGEAFTRFGWDMQPGAVREIGGLPTHVYKQDGETQVKPCAEVLLSDDAAETMLDRGFIPLASIEGADRVRLVRFQSVADPSAPLAGRWS